MELWDKDYKKAIETGKEIKQIIKESEKGKKRTKNRAILRGKITEFNQNIRFLLHQLDNDYIKNDKNYNKNEYKRKVSALEKMKKEISNLYEEYSLTNDENTSFNITMDFLNDFDNDNNPYLNSLNKEELLLKQHNLMKLQDEQLNFLEGTTHNLKNISYNINNEIQVHNELLDDIDRDMDETNNLLNRNRNIFERVTNNTSNYFLYIIIAILTTTLVLFIIIL
ncbi:SNARE protein, putative [Plasmodium malariae]|uniref:SNARE protein, putative n=1 Tax=Plasmodium malariae TaxID=5858 RepID=A0A1A8X738_PLAMA|nr:SNARE protein, putative [Plasmodium malariae]SBT01068.1 SNARE protein, putative [Plasmodium malariae]SBT71585.1 SNARE protein, putative [Plasmodium malariae]SCN44593.1 SNARE protein, putative [Plasmodium malariae]